MPGKYAAGARHQRSTGGFISQSIVRIAVARRGDLWASWKSLLNARAPCWSNFPIASPVPTLRWAILSVNAYTVLQHTIHDTFSAVCRLSEVALFLPVNQGI